MNNNLETKHRIKENGYSHAKADARKATRRAQAEARQAAYAGLSLHDKLHRATLRRGTSAREVARLTRKAVAK